jgi:rhizosphere induced protein
MSLSIHYGKDLELAASGVRAETTGRTYQLKVVNQSAQPWIFFVYQELPKQTADVFSLAWFASPYKIRVHDQVTFSWQIQYDFVWTDTQELKPGVVFEASGTEECDPGGLNTTTFSLEPGPGLSSPEKGPPPGSLVINDASDVPNDEFSVGIGMSGTGTYAVQAGTNLKHTFTPTPTYWVAAGIDQKVGTVLDIETITENAQVVFPSAVYAMTATLRNNNTWDVEPS